MISEEEKEDIAKFYRAEGREQGRAEGREEGRAEGLEEGRAEGRAEGIVEGRTEGMEKGMKKGMEEGKMEVARKMKEMDLTTEQISQATGLSPQAIAAL